MSSWLGAAASEVSGATSPAGSPDGTRPLEDASFATGRRGPPVELLEVGSGCGESGSWSFGFLSAGAGVGDVGIGVDGGWRFVECG